jgi:sarcosine oxidase subunit beta
MRQTFNGEILIGYLHEEVGFNDSTTLEGLGEAAQLAIKLVPGLAKVRVVRGFGGLRVMPEDGHPIMGTVPGIDNLYVAAMHSGVTLAPLAGTLMAELISGQETSMPMDRFSLSRFA